MARGSAGGSNPVIQGALTFLAAGLSALIGGQEKQLGAADDSSYGGISASTDRWLRANFTPAFGYLYKDASTIPVKAEKGTKVAVFNDMLVWDKTQYQSSANVQTWIVNQLVDALPDGVIVALSDNMTNLINTAFELKDNSWEHTTKTYTINYTNAKGVDKTMGVDVILLYSCASNSNKTDVVGICRMIVVAYNTQDWVDKSE